MSILTALIKEFQIISILGYDVVQCVPTKKGHQILYKGFTYVFKIEAEAEEGFPEWVSIYFTEVADREAMKCNLCEVEIDVAAKSSTLIEHMQDTHKDIYDLHKDNPEATVGFRVEFLHMNVLKGDEGEGEDREQPVILGEVCETTEAEVAEVVDATVEPESDIINMQYVMMGTKRKQPKKEMSTPSEQRKRSWIWKYFDRLSNIVYRCTVCNVVLSTKGSNTNNLNRHMRTKHPDTFKAERFGEAMARESLGLEVSGEVETPYAVKTEEIYACNESPSQKSRRSWIWSYFDYVSTTQAKCKLCQRHINHGGNATGNMNRHLKTIHHKTDTERSQQEFAWVWKVFVREPGYFICKICQHRLTRNNSDSDMVAIANHLKREHGVVSGDQIITGTECELEEN